MSDPTRPILRRHGGKQVRSYRTDFHQHHKTTSAGRKVLRNDRQEQEQ